MKREEEILDRIRKKGGELDIPPGLEPEWMQDTLKENARKQYFRKGRLYPALAAAASFCIIAGLILHMHSQGLLSPGSAQSTAALPETEASASSQQKETAQAESPEEEQELLTFPEMTYEEIYARLSESWQLQNEAVTGGARQEASFDAADLSAAPKKEASMEDAVSEAFGQTNIQTAGVDEADRIKNDGRYLYQIARKQTKREDGTPEGEKQGIQILDTKDGLKEAAFLEGFENLEEFYLWKDLIITIENKYYDTASPVSAAGKVVIEDLAFCGTELLRSYHEISIYDVTDKSSPRKQKTFTLQGTYESSRIADGYFYGISSFTANPGEGEEDYDAYIPAVDGNKISADRIYCPEYAAGNSFLVLVSIDLSNPVEFTDTRAVLSGSGICYVSPKNIYMAQYKSVYEEEPREEGTILDKTRLLRFSYLKGRFYAQAEGEIPGRADSSFSMDEYEGNLRIAATVQEYQSRKVTDDRTGELIGYDYGESRETNAVYILGRALDIKGRIEGLAEGEQIKSARFLGDTGYIVTFRQTDPLFAIDLSDPQDPKVLGELKISGFSEYLHFYGENLLLGIGMEVNEETGAEEGMKLSMFDITDPAAPKEQTKLNLRDYNYSEALWDHHAVLIDTSENLIGFEAEGSSRGTYQKNYLVCSYENGAFAQKLKLETKTDDRSWYRTRGTFIGETFYLLCENGTAKSYNRTTGALLEELK